MRVLDPGTRVRVAARKSAGHVRTPAYVRGKVGVIERLCGTFRRPEDLSLGRLDGEAVPLYRVRFLQCEVWDVYQGPVGDTLDVEIYEHWLEPAHA
jgi:nitrile hydratase